MTSNQKVIESRPEEENRLELKWIDGSDVEQESSQNSQWRSEDSAVLDRHTLKALFYTIDWVFIAVDAIAQPLSRVPWMVYRKVMSNGKATYLPDEAHPLNKLLENPSPDIDAATFKYMAFCEDALMGNAIMWYAPTIRELHIIPCESCDYLFDYNAGRPNVLMVYPSYNQAHSLTLPVQDIIHVQRPHASNKWWGLSPFLPTRKNSLFNKYFQDSINAYYQRGAQPQGVLTMEKEANEANTIKLLKKFENAYAGAKNMRRTMLLPKGVSFDSVDSKIVDPTTVELVNLNRESILNGLHIPKHVVSLAESGSLGSQEFKQALKYFWQATLIPISERFAGKMTKFFAKELGPERVIAFNFDDIEVLQEDKKEKATLAKELLSVMTINEVREQVFELPRIEGGDVVVTLRPQQSQFGAGQQQNGMQQPVQQPVQQPPQQQVQASNQPVQNQQQQVPEPKQPEQTSEGTTAVETVKNAKWFAKRANLVKAHNAIVGSEETSKTKKYEAVATKILEQQIEAADKALKKALKEKAATFDEERFSKEYDRLVAEFEDEAVRQHTGELKNTMELGYRSQLSAVFEKTDREAVEALRARGANERLAILNDRGLELFKSTAATTKEQAIKKTGQILETIASGMEDGKTIDQIAKDVGQHLSSNAQGRARTIARTEVLTAVTMGQQAMHKDAQQVIKGLKKVWLNAGDMKVRGSDGNPKRSGDETFDHWSVHGEVVDIDKEFTNGLLYPHDPKGKPGNVINCRCTMLVVPPEDFDDLDIPGVQDIPNRP